MKIEGLQAAVTGAAASLIAQLTTTPLDVIRTRIMAKSHSNTTEAHKYSNDESIRVSWLAEFESLVAREGLAGLSKGAGPRALRAIGSGAIQFASYEITQNILHENGKV